jgi:hypothetical protein
VLGGRGPPGPGDRGLEGEDGVIVAARHVDDEQAGSDRCASRIGSTPVSTCSSTARVLFRLRIHLTG